eukprot:gene35674-27849_t
MLPLPPGARPFANCPLPCPDDADDADDADDRAEGGDDGSSDFDPDAHALARRAGAAGAGPGPGTPHTLQLGPLQLALPPPSPPGRYTDIFEQLCALEGASEGRG